MSDHAFSQPTADVFLPQGGSLGEALSRTTHLGIGAHQDDLEFMAFHGIRDCFHSSEKWFSGVTCTDGAGSARTGFYADKTDADMIQIRRMEQRQAAEIGRFSAMIQLFHPSRVVKDPADTRLRDDLKQIFEQVRPGVVYTHNPADKHETHLGVLASVMKAIWELEPAKRPTRVLGCEVWRDLDWMDDGEKVAMDVSGYENLAASLNGVFDSQIAGGKRYDLAVLGRRRANATFFQSHSTDQADMLAFAMDLTPLISGPERNVADFVCEKIDAFRSDVRSKLAASFGLS